MIRSVVFSPSGTTTKVSGLLSGFLGEKSTTYDITVSNPEHLEFEDEGDIVVFAMPVYAGRIPALAAERLQVVKGNGQKAIAVVVYGNRDYDDALVELCDIMAERGFKVVAAAAFIAEHCIFPKVAAGRPDAEDTAMIEQFADYVRRKIKENILLDLTTVKGSRPYKKASPVPLTPEVDKSRCNECGTCAGQCPAGAIDAENPVKTDSSKCISCCRCINVCPTEARHFGGLLYKMFGLKFVRDNKRRLEPEWF